MKKAQGKENLDGRWSGGEGGQKLKKDRALMKFPQKTVILLCTSCAVPRCRKKRKTEKGFEGDRRKREGTPEGEQDD